MIIKIQNKEVLFGHLQLVVLQQEKITHQINLLHKSLGWTNWCTKQSKFKLDWRDPDPNDFVTYSFIDQNSSMVDTTPFIRIND